MDVEVELVIYRLNGKVSATPRTISINNHYCVIPDGFEIA